MLPYGPRLPYEGSGAPNPPPAGPYDPAVNGTGPDGASGAAAATPAGAAPAPAPATASAAPSEGSASRSSSATAARLASSTRGAGSQPGAPSAPPRAAATASGTGRSAGGDQVAQVPGRELTELGRLVDHLVEEGGGVVPGEGRPAGRREGHDRAEREHVGRPGDPLAEDLLGRHVAGRADGDAGGGERGGAVRGPRDPEVDQPRPVEGEHHVGRLHVAVDEAQPVHGHQGPRQTRADGPYRCLRERPVRGERAVQGGSRHVAGGHPRDRGLRIGVQDRRGPLAADPPGRLDLAAEPGPELLVGGEVRVHDLDGDGPAARAAAQVDPAHATRAEPAEQPVRADGPRLTGFQRKHRVPPIPRDPGRLVAPGRAAA